LLVTNTDDRIQSGAAFMNRLGAQKGLEAHTNQLRLADVDKEMVEDWLQKGRKENKGIELGLWEGAYPEDRLQAIVELNDLTNQQPTGDLDIEDIHWTPQQIRQMEQNIFARGHKRWTFYLEDQEMGSMVGYTETIWNPNRPDVLYQEMTGVFPQYRRRGMGRWLKAAMIKKTLLDRPQVRFIRTGNADSNTSMLKINEALGFKPYMAEILWQVDIDQVMQYLALCKNQAQNDHTG